MESDHAESLQNGRPDPRLMEVSEHLTQAVDALVKEMGAWPPVDL